MAQPLRRPLLSAARRPSPSLFTHPRRCFAQGAPRMAGAQVRHGPEMSEPSLRIQAKEAMTRTPDVGLLLQTFVPPTGKNLPSIFYAPRHLFRLRWTQMKIKFRDLFSNVVLKITSPQGAHWYNRLVKLQRSRIVPSAIALHREMYSAFAAGDRATLRKVCTDSIYDQFRARIASRPRGQKMVWELVRYNKRAKIVSHRSARLPLDGAAVRQAVVRISSRQKLSRYDAHGALIEGTGRERDVVEYVVLDKSYFNWQDSDWRVWGTTEETTHDELLQWDREDSEA